MKRFILSIMITLGVALVPLAAAPSALAIDLFPSNVCTGQDCSVVKAGESDLQRNVQNIINTALYILSALAVITIIIGGIRMIISNGDPAAVKSGRLMIIWSIVGLAVAFLASAIVRFIVNAGWS